MSVGRHAFAAVVLLASAACGGAESSADDAAEGASVEQVVRTDPIRITGAFEGESLIMTPCTDSELQVRLVSAPVVLDLVEIHAELVPALAPVESIFVDMLGEAIEERGEVSFEVLEVYRAGWEDWGCTWQPLVEGLRFAASGTEPDWTLHVATDSTVRLSRIEGMVEGRATTVEGSLAAGWTVSGTVGGSDFSLELEPVPCQNAMSGGWSHLTARATLAGAAREGCGFAGEGVGGA